MCELTQAAPGQEATLYGAHAGGDTQQVGRALAQLGKALS